MFQVINLENVATSQPNSNLFPASSEFKADYHGILRVGIGVSMWLAIGRDTRVQIERSVTASSSSPLAIIQYLIYVIFYQRFVEDRLINFIDLCSMSNISVFILMENQYGYYLHGRSPHGVTDVNMKDMMMHLERESNEMIGTRGLEPKSTEQIFIVRVDRTFRSQYDALLRNYQVTIARCVEPTEMMADSVLESSHDEYRAERRRTRI